jgi:HK97 family phage prohead protease
MIHLQYDVELEAPQPETPDISYFKGRASGLAKNAHGFKIAAKGWKHEKSLQRYKKNSIVLFNHNRDMPIGTSVEQTPDDEGLFVRLALRRKARIPTGETIGDLIDAGVLKAMSCGIDILDVELQGEGTTAEIVATAVALGEISLVTVPSDEDALGEVESQFREIVNLSMAEDRNQGGILMLKLLAKALGLKEDATEAEIMAKQNEVLLAAGRSATIAKSLGLSESATETEIQAELTKRDPKKLADLLDINAKLVAKQLVGENKEKIAPTLLEWALSYAEKDPDGFKAWAAKAPAAVHGTVIPPKAGDPPAPTTSVTLTKEDKEVCEMFGYFKTPEEMEKFANTPPNEALGWIFPGQRFKLTAADKETMERRKYQDRLVGVSVSV